MKRDRRPADMGHYLVEMDFSGVDPAPALRLVAGVERGPVGDAAGLQRIGAEAPASGAEPGDILHRVGPAGELPVEDARQAAVLHHVVAGAEIVVAEDDLAGLHGMRLQPAQAPFDDRVRHRLGIEEAAVERDARRRRVRRRRAEEGERVVGRRDSVQPRELAAEPFGERRVRALADDPVAERYAGHAAHQIERGADDARIVGLPERFRDRHAGGAGAPQKGELVGDRPAQRDRGFRLGAQHQRVAAGMRAAGDLDIERAVFLDRAAGQPLLAGYGGRIRAGLLADERGQALAHGQLQKSTPSSSRKRDSTILWTSDAPSTSRAWRA